MTTLATQAGTLPEALRLIADETRWRLLLLLRQGDFQVGELTSRLGLPQNLVSYHLSVLRQGGLVQVHRSDADGRVLYYGLDLSQLQVGFRDIEALLQLSPAVSPADLPTRTVVFLCTANSARSQMAEAWLRLLSHGRITARSAGTHPRPINPLTIAAMAEVGIDIGYQQAKGIDTLADLQPDLIVTVCDIAREACASWGSEVPQLHWSIPDPAAVEGASETRLIAFRNVRDTIRARVDGLLALLPSLGRP
jgi:ArsR family transcriptional regulator, arsenate/arsenite/antimonite-responsive transcriptional repressor / arsenate reductase (thioredoxin)